MTDREWLDEVVLENYERVKRTAYHIARGRGVTSPEFWAEDMTQETFLRLSALMCKQKLRSHPNIIGWLIKTLKNVMDSEQQKLSNREIPTAELWSDAREPYYDFTESEDPFPPELTDEERNVLYRCKYLGYSSAETAKALGITAVACRKRLQRAEEKYRKILSDSTEYEGFRQGKESTLHKGGAKHV